VYVDNFSEFQSCSSHTL